MPALIKSGNWSDTNIWDTGTVPTSSDAVTYDGSGGPLIVVLDGTSCTCASLDITDVTLQADRTQNSALTVTGTGLSYLRGSSSIDFDNDSNPNPYNFTLEYNGQIRNMNMPWVSGSTAAASATRITTLTADAHATDTVLNVADASIFAVGDEILITDYNNSYDSNHRSNNETRTITGITGNQLTLDSGLSHDHNTGSHIGRLSSNFVFRFNGSTGRLMAYDTSAQIMLSGVKFEPTGSTSSSEYMFYNQVYLNGCVVSLARGYVWSNYNDYLNDWAVQNSILYGSNISYLIYLVHYDSSATRNFVLNNSLVVHCSLGGITTADISDSVFYDSTLGGANDHINFRNTSIIQSTIATNNYSANCIMTNCRFVGCDCLSDGRGGAYIEMADCTIDGCNYGLKETGVGGGETTPHQLRVTNANGVPTTMIQRAATSVQFRIGRPFLSYSTTAGDVTVATGAFDITKTGASEFTFTVANVPSSPYWTDGIELAIMGSSITVTLDASSDFSLYVACGSTQTLLNPGDSATVALNGRRLQIYANPAALAVGQTAIVTFS